MTAPVATLWIGGALSVLEQICLKSFAAQGQPVTLFHYFPVSGVPEGTTLVDAREIYDDDDILIHKKTGSPAMHADVFRIYLMKHTPMMWVDADMFCLRPFEAQDGYAIGRQDEKHVINTVLRFPANSPAVDFMMGFVQDRYPIAPWLLPRKRREYLARKAAGDPVHVSEQIFTAYGPRLLKHTLIKFDLMARVAPIKTWLPLPSVRHRFSAQADRYDRILNLCRPETQGIHLWNSVMKKNGWLDRIEKGSFLHRKAQELDVPITTID